MGVYEADTLPVDDDTFLNGGVPPTPKPTPAPAPTSAPRQEPEPVLETTPETAPETELKPTSEPAPVPEPKAETKSSNDSRSALPDEEPKTDSEDDDFGANVIEPTETLETKSISLAPSEKFESEMHKRADDEAEEKAEKEGSSLSDGSKYGGGSSLPMRPKNPYDNLPRGTGMTVSQAMIPDGMLSDNHVKLEEGEMEEPAEIITPSQAMAENFSSLPPMKNPLMGGPEEENKEESESEEDDEPVVVGPVISSAGMESLTEEQAENPTTQVHAEQMKMEAKIDEDDSEQLKEAASEEKTTEEKPVEEKPAEEKPAEETEKPTEETKPEGTPAEEKLSEEIPVEEKPAEEPLPTLTVVGGAPPVPAPAEMLHQDVAPHAKNTHPMMFIIIGIAVLVVVGLIIGAIMILGNTGKTDEPEPEPVKEKEVFFVPTGDNDFLLYNEDGEKLSQKAVMRYMSGGMPLFNGRKSVVVYDRTTGKVGIMNKDGSMAVDFGKYDNIIQIGEVFYATNAVRKDVIIGDKTIGDATVLSRRESTIQENNNGGIALLEDEKVNLYNGKGKKIFTIGCMKDNKGRCTETSPVISLSAESDSKDDIIVFYYNKTVFVLDADNGEEIGQFTSDASYTFSYYLKDKNIIVLKRILADSAGGAAYDYKFLVKGKLKESEKPCHRLELEQHGKDKALICNVDSTDYYLRDDLTLGVGLKYGVIQAINADTYIELANSTQIKFHKDGKVVKTLDGQGLKLSYSNLSGGDYYMISMACNSKKCTEKGIETMMAYYTADGEKMIDDDYYITTDFKTKSNTALVVDFDYKSFFIDKDGKRISEKFSGTESLYINSTDDHNLYRAATEDNRYFLITDDGNVVAEVNATIVAKHGDHYYYADRKTQVVYDDEGTVIVDPTESLTINVNLFENYIDVYDYKAGRHTLYAYTGKKLNTFISEY